MDILYVVGKGSTWRDNELRFSLRSIAKYGKHVDRVFLVGYKPAFVSDRVCYIPAGDRFEAKHKNILSKVLEAVQRSDISRHFLVSSDDHFYIKPTDFDTLPVYFRKNPIPPEIKPKHQHNSYFLSLQETRQLLVQEGLTLFQTNPHCNTHWDVDVYKQNKYLFDKCFALPHGGEMNCVMGNLLIKNGAAPYFFHDSKLSKKITEETFEQRIGDANCISGNPDIEDSFLAKWLRKQFPRKCRYEK